MLLLKHQNVLFFVWKIYILYDSYCNSLVNLTSYKLLIHDVDRWLNAIIFYTKLKYLELRVKYVLRQLNITEALFSNKVNLLSYVIIQKKSLVRKYKKLLNFTKSSKQIANIYKSVK